jgi:pre-rRNA-processing protein TSR4
MWNSEEEVNENGEVIQLYVAAKGPPRKRNTNTVESHIGGLAHQREAPTCGMCQDSTKLIVQLRLPNKSTAEGIKVDRMLYVFSCSRATCFKRLQFVDGFAPADSGIMACQVAKTPAVIIQRELVPMVPAKSSWYADDNDDDDNDWGVDGGGMESLEQAMAEMENKLEDGALPKRPKKSSWKPASKIDESGGDAFHCYMLTKQTEPPASNPALEDDDVGLSTDDEKIRNMLARYMAEEEDENILAALRGRDIGVDIGEEDERLTEESRLFRGFQDRLHRVPRQVVRYAPGGTPLWSIPSVRNDKKLWEVPSCAKCGSQCSFEMQLLPSILHILQVDDMAVQNNKMRIGDLLRSGINWGSVAVFTCPNPSCDSTVGHLVVQASVDEDLEPNDVGMDRDLAPTMAVVQDMDDDDEFEPFTPTTL